MEIWVPTEPDLDDRGRIRSLIPLLGDAATAFPQSAPTFTPTLGVDFDVKYYETTLQGAATLGLGGLFKVSADGFYQVVIMDTVVGIPTRREGLITPDIKIIGTYWGFSVRVAMRVRMLSASADVNVSYLAAAAEVGEAEIQYSVSAVGIDRKIFAKALRGVPLFGKLDYAAFARLQASLDELKLAMAERLTSHPLVPLGVWLREKPFQRDIFAEGRSVRWAMVKLANRMPLKAVLERAPAWVDKECLRRVYHELLGDLTDSEVTPEAIEQARQWLNVR